uniref:Uncharacterized protein n=1 Tax=Oncorhynchus tshawytscha TaxID=74940 RepID=A0A8C8FG74_ONCTS
LSGLGYPVEWHCVGVGMGTARVSAALVTREGQMKTTAEEPVTIWEPHSDHYVQSSTDIWSKGCSTVRVGGTLKQHNVTPSQSHFCEIKLQQVD